MVFWLFFFNECFNAVAVRQGRYTLEERTKTIKAVQDLKDKEDFLLDITVDNGLQDCQKIPESFSLLPSSNSLHIQKSQENNSEKVQLQNIDSLRKNTQLQNNSGHDLQMESQQSVTFEGSASLSVSDSCKTTIVSPLNKSVSLDSYRTANEWNSPPSSSSSVSEGSPETRETEDDLISKLEVVLRGFRTAYNQFSYPSRKLTEEQLQDKLTDALERHKIQSEVFGPMKQIPAEEYNEIFEATGLDIDGRHGRILKCKELWEDIITQYVGFAKAIPGFTSLTISDQSTILKAARFEFFLIMEYKYIDPEKEVMVVSTGEAFHLEELCFYLPVPMMKRWFDFASKIKDLNLSQDEMLIVLAVSLTFRDRAKLDNPENVEKMQLEMAKYLRHLLKQHHGDKEILVFAKIIDMFVGIRELNNEYLTEFKKMCQDRVLVRTLPEMLEFLFDDT